MATLESPLGTTLGIKPIAALGRGDVEFAGGKGANLGELAGAGLPVPDALRRRRARLRGLRRPRPGSARASRNGSPALDVDDSAALEAAAHEVRGARRRRARAGRHRRGDRSEAYGRIAGDDARRAGRRPLLGHRRGHRGGLVRGHERDLPQRARRRRGASTRCAAAGRRSSARARSSTGRSAASARPTWTSPSSCSARSHSQRAGVMFTIDPSSGATDRLVIEGSFGLGEAVVSGRVSPDRYVVDKGIADDPRPRGPRQGGRDRAGARRRHRGPRADTRGVAAADAERRRGAGRRRARAHDRAPLRHAAGHRVGDRRRRHDLDAPVAAGHDDRSGAAAAPTEAATAPCSCAASAPRRARRAGPSACSARSRDADAFVDGDILVTRMTSPDWVPLMRRAAAIATDSGGMTCHAAIVSRELGIPCVVGTQIRDQDAARRRDRHRRRDARHRARGRPRAAACKVSRAGRRS